MVGIVKNKVDQPVIKGYTLIDADSGETGNYPTKNIEALLRNGYTVGNLRLYNNRVHLEDGLQPQDFPVRIIQENGSMQLVKNQYAIVVLGRLNNGNVALVTSEPKTRELNYVQLSVLYSANKIQFQNATMKIDGHQACILPKTKGFILDESNYPKVAKVADAKLNNTENAQTTQKTVGQQQSTEDSLRVFSKTFKLQKNSSGGYTLQGFLDQQLENKVQGTLYIPEGITYIGTKAFMNNRYIKRVIMPKSLIVIGQHAFNAQLIEEVVLNDGIRTLQAHCFQYCTNLRQINFPEQLEFIYEYAFYQSSLAQIMLRGNLKEVHEYQFYNTKNLEQLVVDAPKCNIESCAFEKQGLVSVEILSANIIKAKAFRSCQKLSRFETRGPVRQIKQAVFQKCKIITELNFGEGLKELQVCLFGDPCLQCDPLGLNKPWEGIDSELGIDIKTLERNLYLPDSLSNITDTKYRDGKQVIVVCQFTGYKVHLQRKCKALSKLLQLQNSLHYLDRMNIEEIPADNESSIETQKIVQRARVIGKTPLEMIQDRFNREQEQQGSKLEDVFQTGIQNGQLMYELDELDTSNFYRDYHLSLKTGSYFEIQENTPNSCDFFNTEQGPRNDSQMKLYDNYLSFIGIKIVNLIQATQASAKEVLDILNNTNIKEVKRTVVGSQLLLYFNYKSYRIRLYSLSLKNRLLPHEIEMLLVMNGEDQVLYQAIPEFRFIKLTTPRIIVPPQKELVIDHLSIGDSIKRDKSALMSGGIRIFGDTVTGQEAVKAYKFLEDAYRGRAIEIYRDKQMYLYMPNKNWVTAFSNSEQISYDKAQSSQQIFQPFSNGAVFNVIEQQRLEDSSLIGKKQKSAKLLKLVSDSLNHLYDIYYSDGILEVQTPAKIAVLIADNIDKLESVLNFNIQDFDQDQMIRFMDQEFMEPIDEADAIELLQGYQIISDQSKIVRDSEWELQVTWLQKQLRYNKVTLQKPVEYVQRSGEKAKSCIYRLQCQGKVYYAKSQYCVNEIRNFVRQYINYAKMIRDSGCSNRYKASVILEYQYGTFSDGDSLLQQAVMTRLQLGKADLQYGRQIKFRLDINPINGCTYLLVELKYRNPIVLIPMKSIEDGLMFFKDATKQDEQSILEFFKDANINWTFGRIDQSGRDLTQLILERQMDKQKYQRAIKRNQNLYKYIAMNQLADLLGIK